MIRQTSLFLLLALAGCATNSSEPKPNLTILKEQCRQWHDSGEYDRAFARASAPANRVLDYYLKKPVGKNAVVFDIDETLLSNWPYLAEGQFAIFPDTFMAWTRREMGIPLVPMRDVYNRAKAAGIPIFLITGRPESIREATIRDLTEAGYSGWTQLYLKPKDYTDKSIVPFKSGVRKMLTDKGYSIILNAGDQFSDLDGGYAKHRVKLPNPFYFLR